MLSVLEDGRGRARTCDSMAGRAKSMFVTLGMPMNSLVMRLAIPYCGGGAAFAGTHAPMFWHRDKGKPRLRYWVVSGELDPLVLRSP